ncbi:hypothetical protein NEF87_003697 [Candidatus Lokiarchaeum ossiferum]|uniref:Glutamine amidotransferase domain-containing protein n=1 Tax=Candidatus Lokiarchaeum ossiferum TaxID=2951803 RepID=A0ABY6HX49_9ARCH|nr:hypothetical protein NEF87_003697 [Candidatus Lokiarchaeum sp. B-35]
MYQILIDLSHNEQLASLPDEIFVNQDLLFSFTRPTDDLTSLEFLQQYDMIFMGNPKPVSEDRLLFTPDELKTLKQYVAEGGNLFLTSGARGDYNFSHELGSLRVFYNLTGIIQYHYAVLFHTDPQIYRTKKWNIKISQFPSHPIFTNFSTKDYLVFGKSTFFSLGEDLDVVPLILAPEKTQAHFYQNKQKTPIRQESLMVANEFHKGKVISLSSSSLFTRNAHNGYLAGANQKLINGIFDWLLDKVE